MNYLSFHDSFNFLFRLSVLLMFFPYFLDDFIYFVIFIEYFIHLLSRLFHCLLHLSLHSVDHNVIYCIMIFGMMFVKIFRVRLDNLSGRNRRYGCPIYIVFDFLQCCYTIANFLDVGGFYDLTNLLTQISALQFKKCLI